MKLLTVDIGNTDVKFGLFTDGRLDVQWRATGTRTHPERFSALLRDSLARTGLMFEALVYASVVPEIEAALRKTIRYCYPSVRESAILAVEPGSIRLPLDFSAYPSEQLGMDRLVNACAARLLFPDQHVIVVDFGTATTFDLVSADGRYLGGAITPGLNTFSECLALKAARLPAITWTEPLPEHLDMGMNTQACMQAGLGIGYRGIIQELLAASVRHLGAPIITTVATGGLAGTVLRLCHLEKAFQHVDLALTLRGLSLLYAYQRRPTLSESV